MKFTGDFSVIFISILLPLFLIVFVFGFPRIVILAMTALYLFVFYKMVKRYAITKFMVWNGYCYWYVKRLISEDDYRETVYLLGNTDHRRLQRILSLQEYKSLLSVLPKGEQSIRLKEYYRYNESPILMIHKKIGSA
ncbi:hypothetical protein [Companilactobacillus mishanensis]|uniref:hypothetical protein n=1 Tax=Companilactobacillus mishanensis TaxID=2486008 RepID=UPI001296BBF0|nr:hypothetical protein [Companilactobacillus mishanensis]MQS90078.1 hypothetical protein [Companilactobacillus mishanensis]